MIFALFLLIFSDSVGARTLDIDHKSFYLPNTSIDIKRYIVQMDIDQLTPDAKIKMQTRIILKGTESRPSIKLHATRDALNMKNVKVNGESVPFQFLKDYVLEIRKAYLAGQQLTIDLSYQINQAQLVNKAQHGLMFSSKNVLSVEDWPYFTRTWIPSNDSPADPAKFELLVTVPTGIEVLSNGKIISEKRTANRTTFHWKLDAEIPSYGVNLVVGNYRKKETKLCIHTNKISNSVKNCSNNPSLVLPLNLFVHSSRDQATEDGYWKTIQKDSKAIAFFSAIMGPYAYEKLAYVDAPQHFNMEYPSLITGLDAAVHELAHHWFGDRVMIKSWGDFWISEGFTTYLTALYDDYFKITLKNWMPTRDGVFNFKEDTDPYKIFNNLPYETGAASIHALRRGISEACHFATRSENDYAVAFAILRSTYQTFKGKNLSTAQFVQFAKNNAVEFANAASCSLSIAEANQITNQWASAWYQ